MSAIGGEADIPWNHSTDALLGMHAPDASSRAERELGDAETSFTDLVAKRVRSDLANQFNPLGAWLLTETGMTD
jgi:hypothetical protein